MKNPGKIFEDDFRDSCPRDIYYLRLHDSSIGFDIKNSTQRFALKSPYDTILCKNGQMYAIELKSCGGTSFSYKGDNAYIKMRQVEELIKAKRAGAISYLVLNFRKYEKTYAIDPDDFVDFINATNKKSINLRDVEILWSKILIPQRLKKTRYKYDLGVLFI